MSRRPDAIVIGAGIVGAASAYALARAGLSVDVLESGFAASGATAAGMGHVVVMDDSEAQFALTSYSRSLLDALNEELPAACEYDRCGTLWLARSDEELDAARAKHAFYTARGVDAELLDSRQLAEAEPTLARPLAGALLVPEDTVLYPPAFAWWLLERAAALGARLREGVAVSAIVAGGVVSRGVRLDAELVVNAAGSSAPSLMPGLPMLPRKGHLAITDRYPAFCRHQLVELGYLASAHTLSGESIAFNLQPRKTGQLLVGSSRELAGADARINRDVLGRMLERAVAFMPALATASVVRAWTGFRPATPDRLPFIGAWEEMDNVWIAGGHEGLGIATALGTAELLADLINGRAPAIDPAPFSPARVRTLAEV